MTGTVWLAGIERIPGNGSGTWVGRIDAPKIVLHSTEGTTIASAVAAFTANNSWPHLTADPIRRRLVEHVGLDQGARALRNTSSPGATNTDGRTYQVEIVGTAARMGELGSPELAWLGAHVIRPLAAATGTPLRARVTRFHQYPPENGHRLGSEPWRLTADQFDAYTGILSHAEIPENVHGDPGALDIAAIIRAATSTGTTPQELTVTDIAAILRRLDRIDAALGIGDPKGPLPERIRDAAATIDRRTEEIVIDTRRLTQRG